MAKWGEGDPRWIVEERADATNVNNWHWTEKNATQWSKDKIKSLLEGQKIENDIYSCEIKELSTLEGEAVANNRKAKLIFFYEWVIKGEWKGNIVGQTSSHKGKFEIPNLSEENDPSELEFTVTISDEKDDDACKLKEFMRSQGEKFIREQLAVYISDLKQEFSQGMILPSKTGQPKDAKDSSHHVENNIKKEIGKLTVSSSKSNDVGVRIPCKKIMETQTFLCRPEDLYRALTDQGMVAAFTRSCVKLEPEKGGRFVLFDGSITGEFTEMVHNERLSMKWRLKSWPAEHYSEVKIELKEKDGETELKLTQTLVPEAEYEQTSQGWMRYYWQPIRQTFGFGASIF